MTVQSIATALEKAGSTETEAIRKAFEDLQVKTPVGEITYRSIDNQSTAGAYVGTTAVRDGKGVMIDWVYKNGADYLLSDEEVLALRPAE
jgi:branched-chain amino acid transport system substrate-binding protein